MQSGNTVQRFSYDAQGKVISVNYNGTEYYYLRNAQGDIVKLIDNNKNTVVEYTYDSWGKLISTAGSLAASLGANQPFRYREYIYDSETQWYYLQSRYYDPNTCRFISSDVYLSTGQGVIGHNSYAYCLNSPVNGHDSDGHKFRPYSVMMTDNGGWTKWDAECHLQIKLKRYEREKARIRNKITAPIKKAANWVSSVATEARNWTSNAAQDVANWVGQAATDVWNQTKMDVQRTAWYIRALPSATKQIMFSTIAEGAAGAVTGGLSGWLGAPYTMGASIPACIAVGALLGAVTGFISGVVMVLLEHF
jgi:RHS repeat-associated protein